MVLLSFPRDFLALCFASSLRQRLLLKEKEKRLPPPGHFFPAECTSQFPGQQRGGTSTLQRFTHRPSTGSIFRRRPYGTYRTICTDIHRAGRLVEARFSPRFFQLNLLNHCGQGDDDDDLHHHHHLRRRAFFGPPPSPTALAARSRLQLRQVQRLLSHTHPP